MIWFILTLLVVALVVEKASLKIPLEQIKYKLEPSKRSVEQGEVFQLNTTLYNASASNIPYVFVEEVLPAEVEIEGSDTLNLFPDGNFLLHRTTVFMRKHQKIKRSIRVCIQERGLFRFRQARMKVGDALGFRQREKEFRQGQGIVVYPRKMQDERLEHVLSDIFGEISVRSFLHEDPFLVRGYRDYTGREPLRSISFLQSAKRNELTVKEYDHTRDEVVDIIFDVSYKGNFEHYFVQLETMFSMARTICEAFENKDISYRLITNAYYDSMEERGVNVIQSGGTGGKNFDKILDILGMASSAAMCRTEELLQRTYLNLSQEKEFVYLCQRRNEETEAVIARIEHRYKIHFFRLYGEDFEAAYLEEENKRKKVRLDGSIL